MKHAFLALGLLLVSGPLAGEAQQRSVSGRTKDVIVTLRDAGNFVFFLQAVEGAGLTQELKNGAEYTIFAPTDDAFGRIPAASRDSLLRDREALGRLIRNHVIEGRLTAEEARAGARGMSFMGGTPVRVETGGTYLRVNGAQLIKPDMRARNGLIHVVDQVWLPPVRFRVQGTNPADSAGRGGGAPGT